MDTINTLTTHTFLVEFLAYGAMLCAMLFLLIIVRIFQKIKIDIFKIFILSFTQVETLAQMIIVSIYIFMILSQSVIMYYFANELYDQSLLVANAAYDCNWFEFDVSTQKTLKLLILRSQKPCSVSLRYFK